MGRLCAPRFLAFPDLLSRKQALPNSVDMLLQGAMCHAFIAGNINREGQIALVEQSPQSVDGGILDISVNDKINIGIPSVVSRGP